MPEDEKKYKIIFSHQPLWSFGIWLYSIRQRGSEDFIHLAFVRHITNWKLLFFRVVEENRKPPMEAYFQKKAESSIIHIASKVILGWGMVILS